MSNRGITTVIDTDGVSRNTVLNTGELVIDATTRQYRVGDGVTKGGLPQVAQFPPSPASTVQSSYDTLFPAWRNRFFDDTGNRLYPTRGLGKNNAGCPDTTLPDADGNKLSPWQWAQAIPPLYDRWVAASSAGVPTAIAKSKARIAGAWAYFQTQFTFSQMVATAYGSNPTSGLSDDNAWFANALWMIHVVTGDATALKVLLEYIAGTYITYQDTRASNPITKYNATTPGGLVPQHNKLGIKYDYGNGSGDISCTTETGLGVAAFYVSQLSDATVAAAYTGGTATASAQALKAAYLQLAKDVWTWAFTYGKWAGSATAVAGLQCIGVNLGNNPGTPNPGGSSYTTQRGYSAFYPAGPQAFLVLSDQLFGLTGTAQYLTELQIALTAYPTQTTGFGRSCYGMPALVNCRDPWTDGFYMGEATRRIVARYPNPTDYKEYKLAVLGAAKVIAAASADGITQPIWGPPELGPNPGADTWPRDQAAGYSGTGGGGQATGRQIMAASSSLNVVYAATLLIPVEAALGSGMSAGAIEILPSQTAAALAALQAAKLEVLFNYGPYSLRVDTANGWVREFFKELEVRRLDAFGETIFGAVTVNGGGVSATGGFYIVGGPTDFRLGWANGRPSIFFDGMNSRITLSATGSYEFYIGGNKRAQLTGNGALFIDGGLTVNASANGGFPA
jgi:hypothetical protein